MPTRTCNVSFIGVSGIRHGVDVEADAVYEAAVKAIARIRQDPWTEQVGPATRLDIEIRDSSTKHSVTLKQVESWLASTSASPHIEPTLKAAHVRSSFNSGDGSGNRQE